MVEQELVCFCSLCIAGLAGRVSFGSCRDRTGDTEPDIFCAGPPGLRLGQSLLPSPGTTGIAFEPGDDVSCCGDASFGGSTSIDERTRMKESSISFTNVRRIV